MRSFSREVYGLEELSRMGYPKSQLSQLAHSDEFYRIGFATGEKKKHYHFFREKLDKLLERRTQWS